MLCLMVARYHAPLSIVVELITSKAAVMITSKLGIVWGIEPSLQDTRRALLSSSLRNDFHFKGIAAL